MICQSEIIFVVQYIQVLDYAPVSYTHLIIAAEKITPEKVNFMLKHARGVLCAPVTVSRCKELDLPHQVSDNTSVLGTDVYKRQP